MSNLQFFPAAILFNTVSLSFCHLWLLHCENTSINKYNSSTCYFSTNVCQKLRALICKVMLDCGFHQLLKSLGHYLT